MSDGTNLPSTRLFGDYNADEDFADMRKEDIILPRLRLAQSMSNPVKAGLVKEGAWYNSATNATVIEEGKFGLVIPVMRWMEWMEWNPKKDAPKGIGEGKAILAREVDPNGKLAQSALRFEKVMTSKGERVKVTEYYCFLVLAPEFFGNYNDMMLLNFSKTSHKFGKVWLNRMRGFMADDGMGKKVTAPMAAVAWELGSAPDVNKDGEKFKVAAFGKGTLLPADIIQTTLAVATKCRERRNDFVKANVAEEKEVDAEVVTEEHSEL